MKRGIGRRQFIQRSLVGAAAAPAIVHVLGGEAAASQAVLATDRIQVGAIGVGAGRAWGAAAIVRVRGGEAAASQAVLASDRIQVGIIGVGARVQSGVLQAAVAVPG